jgi:hypothetical protein
MAKPKKQYLRILGRDYEIKYVPPSGFSHMELGLCDNKTQTISIATDQTPIEATDTFLHEVIHAIDWIIGLELSEHQVRHLAATLVGVIQDNPEWADWLVQDKTLERIEFEREAKGTKRPSHTTSQNPSPTNKANGRKRKSQWSHP